ncbi:MAG: sugar phosphate isomerase/epimerase [Planctomycetaceae bacterium]|nr:sugar phosphate isomerase/epimerase [Planctomycetaceae bacterium]
MFDPHSHTEVASSARQLAVSRRAFCATTAGLLVSPLAARAAQAREPNRWQPNYIVGSSMYGYADLPIVLAEARQTGATAIDLWPKVHGNQREQLTELGEEKFAALLRQHGLALGCITQYPLGPFKLQDEMRLARRLGCRMIVCGGEGPRGLTGSELKGAVTQFVEKLKPHLAVAEETGVTLALENHAHNLIESPDSLKWLAELRPSPRLAIALAPYHLPQDELQLAELIRALGPAIALFYAWQHGAGCMQKQPKEQELLQMPGRGPLDFAPLLAALGEIDYQGWTEIFMHPFPRGVPILESPAAVTAEIIRARDYLETCRPGAKSP